MLPGPAKLFACPFCGKDKAMFTMLSCNTFGATVWSDGRKIYPMRPALSIIQRCESCKSYSLLSEWKEHGYDKDNHHGSTGNLTYEESKEAYIKLTMSGHYDNEDMLSICLAYIHSYNDKFKRKKNSSDENVNDFELFMNASEKAIKQLGNDSDSLITKGELFRERGEFDEAREILICVRNEKNNWIIDPILYHCNLNNCDPFLLVESGKVIDWNQRPNYKTIVNGELLGKRKKINEEAMSFLATLHEKRREKIAAESDGGIYENDGRTLLKILENCPVHYEISHHTEHIAEYAAYRNFNLKSVDFPSSIRSIGARAFWGCKNLQGYCHSAFNTNIISIGAEAFMNCKKIEGFDHTFLRSVRFIGRAAFSGMDSLKRIELPEGLLEIPAFCFGCDTSLTYVDIPPTVTTIEEGAFFCSGLKSVKLPNSIRHLGDFIFSTCKEIQEVQLPKHLKKIPFRTFSMCESLSYIDIPSNVEIIDERAFEETASLKTVRFRGKVKNIDPTAFKNSAIDTIIVPWFYKSHYKNLFPKQNIRLKFL